MPFPGGVHDSIYLFGPVKSASASQLAPSQLGHHYFSDIPVGPGSGQGPFPLRSSNGCSTLGPKSPSTTPTMPVLTQSLLSGRKLSRTARPSIERSDSLEDSPNSGDSDEEGGTITLHLKRAPLGRRNRHNSTSAPHAPILRRFDPKNLLKKSVKFADEVGFDLAQTKLFTDSDIGDWEPDPIPRGDKRAEENHSDDLVVEISEWQVNFSQPAADYLGFREKLEANNLALENVIIKQKNGSFLGTIKVKNIAFKKDVFVRCSFSGWETFADFPAKFCGNGPDGRDPYDTFSFEIIIPEEAENRHLVEFCIGFRAEGKEFWDSNQGKNYQLITGEMKHKKANEKYTDAYAIDNSQGHWGEFASWNRLQNNQPYW